jgi:subtilisin family serine protease
MNRHPLVPYFCTVIAVWWLFSCHVYSAEIAAGQLIIGIRDSLSIQQFLQPQESPDQRMDAIRRDVGGLSIRPLSKVTVSKPGAQSLSASRQHFYVMAIAADRDLSEVKHELSTDARVSSVDYNYLFPVHSTPNDPDYAQQSSYLSDIKAPYAWNIQAGHASVTVAVIDTGIQTNHEDLQAIIHPDSHDFVHEAILPTNSESSSYPYRYIDGEDYDTTDSDPSELFGHGTHVSGIIAAQMNNGLGGTGIAPNIQLMSLRAGYILAVPKKLNIIETSETVWRYNIEARLDTTAIINAISHAVDKGADVINMSFGINVPISETPHALKAMIDYAVSKGVVVVVAAGNNSVNIMGHFNNGVMHHAIPASYDNVLTVSSIIQQSDTSWALEAFSNYGSNVFLSAPGRDIYSSWARCLFPSPDSGLLLDYFDTSDLPSLVTRYCSSSNKNYEKSTGTSMSAPMLSAAIALLLSEEPDLSINAIKTYFRQGATPISGSSEFFGYGLLNIYQTMGFVRPEIFSSIDTNILMFGPQGTQSKPINYPNPFNPNDTNTDIYYYLSAVADVSIHIYDLYYNLIFKGSYSDEVPAQYQKSWNGRDMDGDIVPNGVYLMYIQAQNATTTSQFIHKLVVIR